MGVVRSWVTFYSPTYVCGNSIHPNKVPTLEMYCSCWVKQGNPLSLGVFLWYYQSSLSPVYLPQLQITNSHPLFLTFARPRLPAGLHPFLPNLLPLWPCQAHPDRGASLNHEVSENSLSRLADKERQHKYRWLSEVVDLHLILSDVSRGDMNKCLLTPGSTHNKTKPLPSECGLSSK